MSSTRLRLGALLGAAAVALGSVLPAPASAATGQRLDLKLLVIGGAKGDPTTDAWTSELDREGVPFTVVRPQQGDALPTLVDPADGKHGLYNGVVLGTDSGALQQSIDLSPVYAYEREFGVRQVDGYEFPKPAVGLSWSGAVLPGPFTAQLTAAGKGAFNYLAGPVPIEQGSQAYDSFDPDAYAATAVSKNFVPYLTAPLSAGAQGKGQVIGGFYTHTGKDPAADVKAGVQEVVLTFNYNDSMLQWRLLAPGLVNWVTRGVHLGFFRNYLGNQADDLFLSDFVWDADLHCTPGETNPTDAACPPGKGGDPDAADVRMTANDVTKLVSWQKTYGFKIQMAFNASGASSQDPLTTAVLANKSQFGWINHTYTHPYLGCQTYNPVAAPTAPTARTGAAGALPAGTYTYQVTATTDYGETTPSPAVTVEANGSVELAWAPVPNATGYRVYGRGPGGTRSLAAVAGTSYTDDGAATPSGAAPSANSAGSPALGCQAWVPASTIASEVSQNVKWAQANNLPGFDKSALVTGEHSGLDNPNMAAALTQTGIKTIAADASRQPNQYRLGPAITEPRHPSNVYYNVATWDQLVDEYNTIYVRPAGGGRCVDTSTTTCLDAKVTKDELVQRESRIMLGHMLSNDPRLGYSHQTNLAGDQVVLGLLANVITTYKSWYGNTPFVNPTLEEAAAELKRQADWDAAVAAGRVSASVQDGVVTVSTTSATEVPMTAPSGATLTGTTSRFGSGYAGTRSEWRTITPTTPLSITATAGA